jgi:hypothetical protein
MSKTKKYWVGKPLNHGNKRYGVGDPITLTQRQAANWLTDNTLFTSEAKFKAAQKAETTEQTEDK